MPTSAIAAEMLDAYPRDLTVDKAKLVAAIEAITGCVQACTQCADALLCETSVADLVKCIRTDLDCADICAATVRVVSRQTEYDANVTRTQLQACIAACVACANECDVHARHGMLHCAICARECRNCQAVCQQLLDAVACF